jgi:hypothetical protein
MVARKRMTRPILNINSEIVEERILRGGQRDRVFASYTILVFYNLSVTSVIPLVTYYVYHEKLAHARRISDLIVLLATLNSTPSVCSPPVSLPETPQIRSDSDLCPVGVRHKTIHKFLGDFVPNTTSTSTTTFDKYPYTPRYPRPRGRTSCCLTLSCLRGLLQYVVSSHGASIPLQPRFPVKTSRKSIYHHHHPGPIMVSF